MPQVGRAIDGTVFRGLNRVGSNLCRHGNSPRVFSSRAAWHTGRLDHIQEKGAVSANVNRYFCNGPTPHIFRRVRLGDRGLRGLRRTLYPPASDALAKQATAGELLAPLTSWPTYRQGCTEDGTSIAIITAGP